MKKIILLLLISLGVCKAPALNLTLQECRDMALQSDENIRIAGNNVAGAGLDRQIARTAYLPKIEGSAMGVYKAPDSEMMDMMTLQMRGMYMAGISLTQPVYTGGKIVAANRMTSIGQQISEEQFRAARMEVCLI